MEEIKGLMLINKPINITSMDVIRYLRKIIPLKKIGHAGTLDPLATGLLVVAIGKSTKLISNYMGLPKKYITTIDLRSFSTTDDMEGKKTKVNITKVPSILDIENIIKRKFIGDVIQTPPIYSAIKVNGKRAYELARLGKDVKLKPRIIHIYYIEILEYEWPFLKLEIKCSKGTYIRSIGRDIGKELNTGGFLTELKRISIGEFKIKDSIELNQIKENNWQEFLNTI